MRERIASWYRNNNNNHPLDDIEFYDIVIDSINHKIELSIFQDAIRNVNSNVTEEEINDIYMRYEDLHSFILYYRKKLTFYYE